MATTAWGAASLLAVVASMATVLLLHTTPAGAVPAATGAPQRNSMEFIRRSCSSTLYPALCFSSLSNYASAVAQDPTQLALVAANVSLARVRSVSFHVSNLRRIAAARRIDVRTVSALADCEECLGDAADLTRQAFAELGLIPNAQGPEIAWRVSNAQTWLSAALTYEDTCTDGISSAPPGGTATPGARGANGAGSKMKADVSGRVRQGKQYTSNALALVNSLVGTSR